MKIAISDLFAIEHTKAATFLEKFTYPWEVLPHIKEAILELGPLLDPDLYEQVAEHVWIAKSANIAPTAYIGAPCIIGEHAEIRHCAYIRESAFVGDHCIVGNSTELKNVILFDYVQVPHYNYVGDSILGYKSHMGAGAITSNIKSDHSNVSIRDYYDLGKTKPPIDTKLIKFGAILADHVEVGCNSVLNPGTIIGLHSSIYPLSSVRGFIPAQSILKTGGVLVKKEHK